ncbi:DUF2989 domain-containing protein [Catenovulum sediminis]|uniref:DUF2989 domain-containing protein n=1 Tax=Catenovulum sediminis TaxID=1740262 RepID=A0ABV1RMP0_9ALTE|nr:DUF2989 domain-containing protein [Catenovulum sediminis]
MRRLKIKDLLFATSISIAVSACDSGLSLNEVCQSTPQICEDLNTDAWCKQERKDVILGRYAEMQNPTDDVRYKLIMDFEAYSTCVEKASFIEHIKLKDKQTGRVRGFVTSVKELERLSNQTKDSNHPHLLYWHWSRNGDEQAMSRFLALRDSGILQTPELQFKLATYYVKFNRDLTIDTLYHALTLYDGEKPVNPEILKTLSTLYLKDEKYKHAYVWGKLAKEFGVTDIDLAPLRAVLKNQSISIAQLNDIADDYGSAIENGEFTPPRR